MTFKVDFKIKLCVIVYIVSALRCKDILISDIVMK